MTLVPDIPDFNAEPSIQRLKRVDVFASSAEIDLAIAQDVLNSRISVKDLQALTAVANYGDSSDGDSFTSWVFRLGGAEAVKENITTLPSSNQARGESVIYLSNLAPDKGFFLNLAQNDKNVEVIRVVLEQAIATDDYQIVGVIEGRLDELRPEVQAYESAIYSWLKPDIENYKLERELMEKGVTTDEQPEDVLPFIDDPRCKELDQKRHKGEITEEEFRSEQSTLLNERSSQLRRVVAYAFSKGDPNILQRYLQESGFSGDIMQDRIRFTLGEITIINKGISILERKKMPSKAVKPVYEITDVAEAEAEFDREAAKFYESEKEIMHGQRYRTRVATIAERAYWLVIRLAQLGDISKLKQIVDDKYASIGVKKEAVRQLLLSGETKFLEGYALKANQPVNFWDNKVQLDRHSSNPNLDENLNRDSAIRDRLENDLPSYVSAIFEAKV